MRRHAASVLQSLIHEGRGCCSSRCSKSREREREGGIVRQGGLAKPGRFGRTTSTKCATAGCESDGGSRRRPSAVEGGRRREQRRRGAGGAAEIWGGGEALGRGRDSARR